MVQNFEDISLCESAASMSLLTGMTLHEMNKRSTLTSIGLNIARLQVVRKWIEEGKGILVKGELDELTNAVIYLYDQVHNDK